MKKSARESGSRAFGGCLLLIAATTGTQDATLNPPGS